MCRGKSCRKCTKDRDAALERAAPSEVREVGCQKICKGPVFGLEVEGVLEWFERVDSEKSRIALRLALDTGELTKPLAKRRSAKRRGKLR